MNVITVEAATSSEVVTSTVDVLMSEPEFKKIVETSQICTDHVSEISFFYENNVEFEDEIEDEETKKAPFILI